MDKVEITGLSLNTRIGVHAWEQQIRQKLMIDIIIPFDLTRCQDELANTIDYAALCKQVTEFVETQSFKLIETVAEQVAILIKEKFQVDKLSIRVSKPFAVKNAGNISILKNC